MYRQNASTQAQPNIPSLASYYRHCLLIWYDITVEHDPRRACTRVLFSKARVHAVTDNATWKWKSGTKGGFETKRNRRQRDRGRKKKEKNKTKHPCPPPLVLRAICKIAPRCYGRTHRGVGKDKRKYERGSRTRWVLFICIIWLEPFHQANYTLPSRCPQRWD